MNQQCDHRKAFANLLISKERISVNFTSVLYQLVCTRRLVFIMTCRTWTQLSVKFFHSTTRKLRSKHWEPENDSCSTLQLDNKGLVSLKLLMRTWPFYSIWFKWLWGTKGYWASLRERCYFRLWETWCSFIGFKTTHTTHHASHSE